MSIDPTTMSNLERAFDTQFIVLGQDLPKPQPNYEFAKPRKFAFDRAWPKHKVAVELEGIYRGSAPIVCHNCSAQVRAKNNDGSLGKVLRMYGWHQRYSRFKSDKEKYNLAIRYGWFVIRFIHDDVHGDPFAMVEFIRETLESRKYMVSQIDELSPREDQIIHLIAAGYTGPQIAKLLRIGIDTVRSHTQNIRQKLLARNQADAVARASAWGLLDLSRVPWPDESPDNGI